VIHAHVKVGKPIGAGAGKTMGFDCIKPYSCYDQWLSQRCLLG